MQIEIDETTGEIVVGKFRQQSFRVYLNGYMKPAWKSWVQDVAKANGVQLPSNKKDFNKAACEMLGRAPTKAYAHFKGLSYKHFVVPHREILTKIAFSRRGINVQALRAITKNSEVLKEVYNDKLFNLLPVVAYTGKSPAELRKEYGSKWKVIANNSLNKNRVLAKVFPKEMYGDFCDKPTTILQTMSKYVDLSYLDNLEGFTAHAALHLKGSWSNIKFMRDSYNMYRDTIRMGAQLNLKVDPKWTPRRMKEEHDKMSQEINARRYPTTAYACVSDIPHKNIEVGEYTAVLLESGFDIADEGTQMGHCVGGYASYVADGDYLVYSVRKDGERSSTIGIRIERELKDRVSRCVYKFNQHYARFNRSVTCDVEKSIPYKILDLLNKKEQHA